MLDCPVVGDLLQQLQLQDTDHVTVVPNRPCWHIILLAPPDTSVPLRACNYDQTSSCDVRYRRGREGTCPACPCVRCCCCCCSCCSCCSCCACAC
jgi:hypothetical protein